MPSKARLNHNMSAAKFGQFVALCTWDLSLHQTIGRIFPYFDLKRILLDSIFDLIAQVKQSKVEIVKRKKKTFLRRKNYNGFIFNHVNKAQFLKSIFLNGFFK